MEFVNRQLKIARVSLAYFKVGSLLSLCEYSNDWVGFSWSVILFVRERLKAKSAFSQGPESDSEKLKVCQRKVEGKVCFFKDS